MIKTLKICFWGLLTFAIIFNACQKIVQYYEIDNDKCTSCYKCVTVCGYGAISVDSVKRITSEGFEYETTVRIDPKKCVACGKCTQNCPSKAIRIISE